MNAQNAKLLSKMSEKKIVNTFIENILKAIYGNIYNACIYGNISTSIHFFNVYYKGEVYGIKGLTNADIIVDAVKKDLSDNGYKLTEMTNKYEICISWEN
jgi:hypothetical protein